MARKQQELKSVISVYGKADGSLDTLARKSRVSAITSAKSAAR